MRGWSVRPRVIERSTPICPAYAGMILWFAPVDASPDNLSRVCGDDPLPQVPFLKLRLFVPRMRGWSWPQVQKSRKRKICPAYAGMILDHLSVTKELMNLSRVCGDDPAGMNNYTKYSEFVPRMRGWSLLGWLWRTSKGICPAYAGMIPSDNITCKCPENLSRVCGDDPLFFR